MAATQQGRKKSRDAKRKKTQKKHQQVSRKQKKHQSLLKRGVAKKAVSSEQEKIRSPRLFASKILRQMPKVRMEAKARGLVKTLLTDLYSHVATEVETLSQTSESSTVSCTDVHTAFKGAMEKELAKHSDKPPSNECA